MRLITKIMALNDNFTLEVSSKGHSWHFVSASDTAKEVKKSTAYEPPEEYISVEDFPEL
jgi:hypothetical protein